MGEWKRRDNWTQVESEKESEMEIEKERKRDNEWNKEIKWAKYKERV